MSMSTALRRVGVNCTVHGFRTSFRTWCSEVAHAEFEVAEAALSHRVGNAASRSYNRTDLLDRRRSLMAAWADCVCGNITDNVVPMEGRGVIPVEVTTAPWHYTTFWDWADHWQTLLAGFLAFVAGVGTVLAAICAALPRLRSRMKNEIGRPGARMHARAIVRDPRADRGRRQANRNDRSFGTAKSGA